MSWVDVLHHMREILQSKGFTQLPQLTSSRMIDVQHDHFVITPDDGSFRPTKNTQRAVLIGINYTGQSGQLSGCHNDVHNIAKYLMDVQGFRKENVTILLDDGVHKSPTKSAILSAYKRLVKESKDGDVVFCHYSGHGGRVRDDNGDEEDGYDETLIPLVSNATFFFALRIYSQMCHLNVMIESLLPPCRTLKHRDIFETMIYSVY